VRVAVAEDHQGRGIGQQLLAAACAALGEDGAERVILGTGACSVANLAFYQKAGFRMLRIERDYFTPANGYPEGIEENGIPLLDMVWFDREL
jgi:ribosomal protein S18 acetylase RimI-like enzyme